MSDIKINLLLQQLVNNPNLQDQLLNTPRLKDQSINDPLIAGVDTNTPLLFKTSINTANLFDVRLDLFILLKEFLFESVSVSDSRFTISQDKSFRSILKFDDAFIRDIKKFKQDTLKALDSRQLKQNVSFRDTVNFTESQDFLEQKVFIEKVLASLSLAKKVSITNEDIGVALDTVHEIKRRRNLKFRESISVISSELVSKALQPKETLKSTSRNFLTFATSLESKNLDINDVRIFNKVTKSQEDDLELKKIFLVAKALINREVIEAASNSRLKTFKDFNTDFLSLNIKTIQKSSTKLTRDSFKSSSSLLHNVAKSRILKERIALLIRLNKKLESEKTEKVTLSENLNELKTVKLTQDNVDSQELFLFPRNFLYNSDVIKFPTVLESKKLQKPVQELLGIKTPLISSPNKNLKDIVEFRHFLLTPKAKIASSKIFADDLIKINRTYKFESFAEFKEEIARSLVSILKRSSVNTQDHVINVSNFEFLSERLSVKSKDRDNAGIGDVSFILLRNILEKRVKLVDKGIVKEVYKPVLNESNISNISSLHLAGRSKIVSEQSTVDDELFAFKVSKGVKKSNIGILEDVFLNEIFKPFRINLSTNENLVTNVAKAKILLNKLLVDDGFRPWVLKKAPPESKSKVSDSNKLSAKLGINDNISPSIRGHAFMRDEDYVRGAYFLEPYVATIPPGNSRQF